MTMRSIQHFLLILALIAICSGVALGQGWRGIVPFHSTRSDVEKLLGPAPGWNFDLENELVHFEYQTPETECGTKQGKWNVPVNTVLGILVVPKQKKSIAEYGVDSTYVKTPHHLLNNFNYTNKDLGIIYLTNGDIVGEIVYQPTLKDLQRLACPKN